MVETGIVRKVDELGRIVLPKEMREMLGVQVGDPLEIFQDETGVYLRKYAPGCVFCGTVGTTRRFKGQNVCPDCAREISAES